MSSEKTTSRSVAELREIAEQANVELAILLSIEESLRLALQWMMRDHGNSRKLSTLRFHTSFFERQLARVHVMADHGGYMNLITDANPHLAGEVAALRSERTDLHGDLEKVIIRLEYVSPDDSVTLGKVCADLERFLDAQRAHGQRECELLQHSFAQEEGGSG